MESDLIDALETIDLQAHIIEGVPEPTDPEKKSRWIRERAAIRTTMRQRIDPSVQRLSKNNNWNYEEKDPKVAYDLINKVLPKVSTSRLGSYILGFITKRLAEFATLDCGLPEMVEKVIIINAVEAQYEVEAKLWRQEIETITWETLINKLMQTAREEASVG